MHRGVARRLLVRIINTVVISVTTHGSEVWWLGLRRPTIKEMVTPQDSISPSDIIDKTILTGLHATLPFLRTTSTSAVQRKEENSPAKYLLEGTNSDVQPGSILLTTRIHWGVSLLCIQTLELELPIIYPATCLDLNFVYSNPALISIISQDRGYPASRPISVLAKFH